MRNEGGIAMVAHPGRYWRTMTVADYVAWYLDWPELFAMEVVNQGDKYPGDRALWDAVQVALLPFDRPVWAMANDDMHLLSELGNEWNLLLLPELSPAAVRSSLETGQFFFVHVPQGAAAATPPEVHAIVVDAAAATIILEASGHARIEWIANGTIVHEGGQLDLEALGVEGFVRAMVYAAPTGGAFVGTQPIFVRRSGD